MHKGSCLDAGAPAYIPWEDHDGEPRFICDVMTEGLAKQLRLYGVDAAAVESKGKGSRHLVYRSAPHLELSVDESMASILISGSADPF